MQNGRTVTLPTCFRRCAAFFRQNRRESLVSALLVGYCTAAPGLGMLLLVVFLADGDRVAALDAAARSAPAFALLVVVLASALSVALFPSFGVAAALAFSLSDRSLSLGVVVLVLCLGTWAGILIGKRMGRTEWPGHPTRHPRVQRLMVTLPLLGRPTLGWILVCLRLSPHVPFALTNIVIAQLPLSAFALTALSIVGLLPRTLFAWHIGTTLDSWSALSDQSGSIWDEVALSGALLAIVGALGWHAKKKIARMAPLEGATVQRTESTIALTDSEQGVNTERAQQTEHRGAGRTIDSFSIDEGSLNE
jgi:uncharacterized membrane protein YdjX (TVP38/TMEM64 family)